MAEMPHGRPLHRWVRRLMRGSTGLRPLQEIDLHIDGMPLDVALANALAEQVAGYLTDDYLLLAWRDGQRQETHPSASSGQRGADWLQDARGYGGNIHVCINGGEFEFVFAEV